jgi:type IV fimbrial biogenesis protein FimT
MVVVAIIAVLAALAGPSFTPLIERWRVRDAAETLTSSIYYARSEAIKRGGNIIIIKNPNSGACTTADKNTNGAAAGAFFLTPTATVPKTPAYPLTLPMSATCRSPQPPHG